MVVTADPGVTLQDVECAARRMHAVLPRTPILRSPELMMRTGASTVALKLECLQPTGSTKARGTFHRLLGLDAAQRQRGVVASTGGNRGLALARAGVVLGIPVRIILPETTDPAAVNRLRFDGAGLRFASDITEARCVARQVADAEGLTVVSPRDDADVIAGCGTAGLELLADAPELDLVVVGVGKGAFASGIRSVMASLAPTAELWSVYTAEGLARDGGSPAVEPVQPGMRSPSPGLSCLECQQESSCTTHLVNRPVTVSGAALSAAMRWLLDAHQLVAEPAGAAAGSAVLEATPGTLRNRRIGIFVTGRNIRTDAFLSLTWTTHARVPSSPPPSSH